ncbi:MAG: Nitrogen regulation protein NtrY (EC 2.7.3.-) [Olavius algarvensis Delta 4 endosymbiont]|nr:MAG: Nitrogen regulation protein NtrY (EC 2.7.3.-) [Olavius algarvensis Delta 4 endosymbiont]
MSQNFSDSTPTTRLSPEERRRRKREAIIIVVAITLVALLTFVESRVVHLGTDLPISNTILMFILININLLLLILLLFLVLRNLVKLLYDRRRKVMGARLRTRLVIAFVALTLLPSTVLFFFSINFITNSLEFWFNVPIEQALENSIRVGRSLYNRSEDTNLFFLERAAYQIKTKKMLAAKKRKALNNYIQVVQRAFNLDAIEVYDANTKRITYAIAPELEEVPFNAISADNLRKEMMPNGVRSITETLPNGEFVRTIGTIPFKSDLAKADALLAISVFIPPAIAENLQSISRGIEEYQQIKLLKKPIQISYFISLSIVALLVVFCAIWFGFYLAKTITIPIMELADGTRKVADGDLSFSINMAADDEIGSLVDSFNKMTHDLRVGREQLEHSAKLLKDRNVEIEEQRQFLSIVLRNVSAGVVTLDAEGVITTINKSAERMLALEAARILNRPFFDILTDQHLNLAREIMDILTQGPQDAVDRAIKATVNGQTKSFLVTVNALKDDENRNIGVVVVFDDLTEQERAQKVATWREVARRIAHEVKNPLTPISLSAQRLKRKYVEQIEDPVFEECTRMIIDHVDLIRNLVNEFSAFAQFPTTNPTLCDIGSIIEETVTLYREGLDHVSFKFRVSEDIPSLNLDRQQIKQAMINLIDNAVAAMEEKGRITIDLSHDEILKMVRIEVADNGPGISDEDKTRLFEPNFSTKRAGMGLGLTIVSSIVLDHNGRIRVQDNHPNGAKFVIELPVDIN